MPINYMMPNAGKCIQGAKWRQMKGDLELMYFEQYRTLGRSKGWYRHKVTGEEYYHWLTMTDLEELDAPLKELEPLDLLLIDISPDFCGGIVVPRTPETLDELWRIQAKIFSGDIILRGFVKFGYIKKGINWL